MIKKYKKKKATLFIEKLKSDSVITTLEGQVNAVSGDFLVHGVFGEVWPISINTLGEKYRPLGDTVFGETGYYECLPVNVFAYQVKHSHSVMLTDRGSELLARKDDWILSNESGCRWVVRSDIFHATYESAE